MIDHEWEKKLSEERMAEEERKGLRWRELGMEGEEATWEGTDRGKKREMGKKGQTKETEKPARKRRKLKYDKTENWGEEDNSARTEFLYGGALAKEGTGGGGLRQQRIKPLVGMEWEGRVLVEDLVGVAVLRVEQKLKEQEEGIERRAWNGGRTARMLRARGLQ